MNQTLSATNVKVTVKIITQKFCPHIFSLFRTFALICAKISIYFNIRIYFFVHYILIFQNTSHQIIYFTLFFSIKKKKKKKKRMIMSESDLHFGGRKGWS